MTSHAHVHEKVAANPPTTRQSLTTMTRFAVSELTRLHVHIAELRFAPSDQQHGNSSTWRYVLHIRCGRMQWQLVKRYREIRGFWVHLKSLLSEDHLSCSERYHFLAGLEDSKFPKKRLLHTRNVLEARANELDRFFTTLCMRLQLCNPQALTRCQFAGCAVLALLTSFFEMDAQCMGARRSHIYNTMTSYRRMPVLKNRDKEGKQTYDGRLSLASLQEVCVA
jgi:hypothetical protein